MSKKNLDKHNRFRSKTIAFRVSPQESRKINAAVRLYGVTKQDYIITCLIRHKVVVQGNPRVYKALRDRMDLIYQQLLQMLPGTMADEELLEELHMIVTIMEGMRKEDANGR